jgi:hypothetical protein
MASLQDLFNIELPQKPMRFARVEANNNELVAVMRNPDGSESSLSRDFLQGAAGANPELETARQQLAENNAILMHDYLTDPGSTGYLRVTQIDKDLYSLTINGDPEMPDPLPPSFIMTPDEIAEMERATAAVFKAWETDPQMPSEVRAAATHNAAVFYGLLNPAERDRRSDYGRRYILSLAGGPA